MNKKMIIGMLVFVVVAVVATRIVRNDKQTTTSSNDKTADNYPCKPGEIYSQKDCQCVSDREGCSRLKEEDCNESPTCYMFTRSGSCTCPKCELLSLQCLPKE